MNRQELKDPDSFFRTRSGLYVWNDFRNLVVAKASFSAESRAIATKSTLLKRNMTDVEIEEMLGDEHIFTETEVCALIEDFISKQEGGKGGKLLNNGFANIFYTGSCVVCVYWNTDSHRWYVDTWKRDSNEWDAGIRVFSPGN